MQKTVNFTINGRGKAIDYYKIAIKTRDFEIKLFWHRSIFFAGFVSAVFTAYHTIGASSIILKHLLTCVGILLSLCWCLANRGSKYWYESWEKKVCYLEKELGANLFACWSLPNKSGCLLFHGSFRSVSKLAMAVSYIVLLGWIVILGRMFILLVVPAPTIEVIKGFGIPVIYGLFLLMMIIILIDTKTTIPNNVKQKLGNSRCELVSDEQATTKDSEMVIPL